MTEVTGAPIYLVSACSSGEEFVAAFRRYADRNGVVFVPIADPLPSGHKGRFALTLKDGGVMVEGEAEVVSSARTPSVLYGRVGMTMKFLVPDEPSKTTLGELEKARLALKPQPPTIAPRPAEIPAEPRPKPPPATGRIDAVNALAECVAIGEGIPAPGQGGEVPPKNPNPKFIVPSVPSVPAATPTTMGVAPLQKPAKEDLSTTMRGTKPATQLPASRSPQTATPLAPMPIVQLPAPPVVAVAKPRLPEIEVGEPTDLSPIPQIDDPVPEAQDKPKDRTVREPRRTVIGVAVVPSGVMVLPAAPAIRVPSEDEVRDTGVMNAQSPQPIARGVAVDDVDALGETIPPRPMTPSMVQAIVEEPTPSGDWTMTPGADGPTITATPREKLARAGTSPAPAGPQTGDWMIALDPSQPDGWSEPSKIDKRPAGELPPGPPESVVSSARPLDSNKRLGTEPSIDDSSGPKVQIDPTLIEPLTALPDLDGDNDDDDDDDPPLPPPPAVERPMVGDDGLMPTPTGSYEAPAMSGAKAHYTPGAISNVFTPAAGLPLAPHVTFTPPRVVNDGAGGYVRQSNDLPSYGSGPTPAITDPARRKRMIVILASAVVAAVLAVILVLALSSDKPNVVVTPTPMAGRAIDAGSEAPLPADAAAPVKDKPDVPVVVATATDCKVSVSSVPSGAEILIGKEVVGKTPAALTLPCGAESKLVVRKARFVAQTRTVTPKVTGGKPIKVALAKVTYSVKVSSTPTGASITVEGKSMGFTPTTVKLPAFESSTLKIAKVGFTAETKTITPKQNNQTVHAALKKLTKRGR